MPARIVLGFLLALVTVPTVAAQDVTARDSTVAMEAAAQTEDVVTRPVITQTPRGALLRGALAPGWGQIYNRQYFKLPIVYGGIAAFTIAALRVNSDYVLYRRAFQYRAYQDLVDSGALESNPREDGRDEYEQLAAEFGQIAASPLEANRDNLRRNRDLSILGVGLVWALGVLDAYVSAHLLDFDTDENLALSFAPVPVPGQMPQPGVKLRIRFP